MDEIVTVPGSEERTRANYESSRQLFEHARFGCGLAFAVDIQRRYRVAFNVRRTLPSIENKIRGERHQRQLTLRTGAGKTFWPGNIFAAASCGVSLRVVHPNIAGG